MDLLLVLEIIGGRVGIRPSYAVQTILHSILFHIILYFEIISNKIT